MAEETPKAIHSRVLWQALVKAGIFRDDEKVRRIVIDAQAGGPVVMYVERWADERVLDIVQTLDGVEIRGVPADGTAIPALAEAVHEELLAKKRRQGGTTLGLA